MGCFFANNVSNYEQVNKNKYNNITDDCHINIQMYDSKSNQLQRQLKNQMTSILTISTKNIRKIFCHFVRKSHLETQYFTNIPFSNKVLDIITLYIEDFFTFHSNFKYSKILLSNNNKTATLLTTSLIDREPNYSQCGDRLILYGLPIFPRKDYIYYTCIKIDKCSNQTIAICFISDYFYFKLNYLQQVNIEKSNMKHILDRELLGYLPIKYGSYTVWCSGKETETWNHCKKSKWHKNKNNITSENYLVDYINFDFCDDDNRANKFTDCKHKKIGFKMFDIVSITIDGFKNIVIIENKNIYNKNGKNGNNNKLVLNIPKYFQSCFTEDDHKEKVYNLKNFKCCYNNCKDNNRFIYPLNKDKMDDDILNGDEHNPQFQIAFVLYDGDDSHGQISIVDQSWSYLT